MSHSLRPIHSLRVSKPGKNQPNGLRTDKIKSLSAIGSHRLKREDGLGASLVGLMKKKVSEPLAKSSPGRSTRRLKKP